MAKRAMAWLSVSSVVRLGNALLVILVAFGLADGEGHGQVETTEELFEIGGVLAGGIDAHMKVSIRMLVM
jgi:hypothetical protein